MKAVLHPGYGGFAKLDFGDAPVPVPGPDMVLIQVELISIESIDVMNLALSRWGLAPPLASGIPGCQACGTVAAVGESVTRFRQGDRVVGFHTEGSHAEYFAAPEESTWHLPAGIDPGVAAAAPFMLAAAHGALLSRGQLQSGQTVLINRIDSGLGIAMLQLASEVGATVIGLSSETGRYEALHKLGLSQIVDPEREDVIETCLAATGGRGVDAVMDISAGETFALLSRIVRPGGRYGSMVVPEIAGWPPQDNADQPLSAIHRFRIMPAARMGDADVHALVERQLARVVDGTLRVPIEHEFALCEAADAYEFARSGKPFGHIVMRP